ncbi:hypothetical protein D3C87_912610 [compost metagenome]
MNESHPNNIPPASEPKIPGEAEPTDSALQSHGETDPLLGHGHKAEELEGLEPEEPVGTPDSNQPLQ